ncbi:MAG: DUF4405 domain-containing protein, partial [Candidatus Bathyarchaeota archaeon]|nr:DUF4405 domain-containing protein [Candidatus Bathyarchaeota archaeon]
MNKLVAKVLVDVGMAVTMLASFVTGVVLWLVLPEGRRACQPVFLGITRHLWSDVHTYSTLGFRALLLIYLVLNWGLFL